jgi:RNA polymerase sigma-70 factor, ECF subfamily
MSIDNDPRRDEELMTLLRSGHDEPLGVLIARHGVELARFFLIRTRDAHAAQDLANETFYRIFSKARTFEPTKAFRPWFYTVATNVPRLAAEEEAARGDAREGGGNRRGAAPGGAVGDAAKLLDQLSEVDREILVLRHYEGLKLNEVAKRIGMSPGAVYTRLFRALEKLRSKSV